ncbi:MAG: SDR family NAD(P)-dependent oxidoreductase [Sphingomonas oligoaromativorans]
MQLEGQGAVITGGTSGIGAATAILFAREGAFVTIVGRSEQGQAVAETITASGGKAQFHRADVCDPRSIEAMLKAHGDAFGRVDVLFNNAAYEGSSTLVADTPDEEFDKVIATNFKAVFTACKLVAPVMLSQGGGAIINTTAASAREGLAWAGLGAYIGSKGAVTAFTRALAVELAPTVRVNSLCPGIIETPMLRGFIGKQAGPEAFEAAISAAPKLGRMGRPEEIAQAALFLASSASSYVTGIDLLADGGLVLN